MRLLEECSSTSLFFWVSFLGSKFNETSALTFQAKVQPDNGYGCASLLPALGDLKLSSFKTTPGYHGMQPQ